MPFVRSTSFLLLSLLLVLPACGSDKKNAADGGETDSGQDGGGSEKDSGNKPGDAGKDSGSDAGKDAGGDASADASTDGSVFGMTDITVTATVKVEGAAAAVGVKVNTLSVDGELLATGTTDGTGTVTLGVQSNKYNFIHVEGTGTEFGAVVVQDPRNSNYTVDGGIATEKRNLFEGNLADLTTPVTYDNQKGNFVVGFTLDMATMSGMGASLANVTHDQVFILDHDVVNDSPIETATIPPVCGVAPCRPNPIKDENMFFPNVSVGLAKLTITSGGATCAERSGFTGDWPIVADARTKVIVDCE